jgi:CRISPR-associated protein Csy1
MTDPRLAEADGHIAQGRHDAARALLDALLAAPTLVVADRRVALLLRAEAYQGVRNAAAAVADLRGAIALEPSDPKPHNALGIALVDLGDSGNAIAAFRRAVELDPDYARAWNNLGNALRDSGRGGEAQAAFRRAVTVDPKYALAWTNLAAIAREQGDDPAAENAFRRALAAKPDQRSALTGLAAVLRSRGDVDQAASLYARAAELDPRDAAPLLQRAGCLAERDDLDGARGAYGVARARRPSSLRAALGEALTLPMVYQSAQHVADERGRYAAGLARLAALLPELARGRRFADVIDDLRWSNFLLAYQGDDDRELQARYAAAVAASVDAVAPEWRVPPPRAPAGGRRLRVGFASSFFSDGTVGMYFRRWIESIDRARCEVFVYHLRVGMNPFASALAARVDHFRRFEGAALAPSAVAPAIRADALDVLVFPELGMDATSFALAALKLAPAQACAWGHPVTTGHATIDAYLTCGPMEPADAATHYTEPLRPLPGIGTSYARPAVPVDASPAAARAELGLPPDAPLLLCPQSLFKIHPDNDALFARVLGAAPRSKLVVFEGRHPVLTARWRARFAAACAREGVSLDERLVVRPQCSHPEFLRINAACDAMLDTLRWSGGNTSLDAIAAGLPIVTQRGRFMRGRQSAAMLELAGVPGLVAVDDDAYVGLAARLATDRDFREAQKAALAAGAAGVFDDAAPMAALAGVLEALARGG